MQRPDRLYHFSEDPSIQVFQPHVPETAEHREPRVWAIDPGHQQFYWYPRDCPRIAFWPGPATPAAARDRYNQETTSPRVHAAEWAWYERIRDATIYRYSFDPGPFISNDTAAGHWITTKPVEPMAVEPFEDLLDRHAASGEELRFLPSLWPLWDYVISSGLGFSGTRLRNATRR